LKLTLTYCNTPELQKEAVRALSFKCDVLWAMLDAIEAGCADLVDETASVPPARAHSAKQKKR
jgi:pyrroloquinoline quinone (PQQ) biosynthesis protein C